MRLKLLAAVAIILTTGASAQSNVTLEMELETGEAYVDGEKKTASSVDTDLSFGFVSTDEPLGIVSYRGEPIRAEFSDGSSISLTSNLSQQGSEFMLPNTRGGHGEIEERQDLIQEHELLSELSPSISFPLGGDRMVRVSYDIPYAVHDFRGPRTGIDSLLVRNRIHSGSQTELILKAE